MTVVRNGRKRHWSGAALSLGASVAGRLARRWVSGQASKYQKTSRSVAARPARRFKSPKKSKSYKKRRGLFQSGKTGVGGTFSTYKEFHKGRGRAGKLLGKSVQNVSGAIRITGSVGQQAVLTVMSDCTDGQLTSMMALAGGAGSRDSYKYLLKSVSGFTIYTNQSNSNVNLKLYDIVSRRDLTSGATQSNDPAAAFFNGMTDNVTTGTVSTVSSTNLGATPFMSPLFTMNYVVKKVTTIILAAGQSHHHYVKRVLNKVINDEMLTYPLVFKGLTHFTMAVAHGYPENDTATTTIVSTSAVAIDTVSEFKFNWAYASVNFNRTTYNNGLGTIIYGELMQEAAGLVKTEVSA